MLDKLIGPVTGLLDKFIEDKDKKNAIAFELSTMAEKHAQELAKAQLEVNKTEAAHKSLFVSGWRPAVGWTCCLGLASNYLLIPMANFTLALADSTIEVPILDMSTAAMCVYICRWPKKQIAGKRSVKNTMLWRQRYED